MSRLSFLLCVATVVLGCQAARDPVITVNPDVLAGLTNRLTEVDNRVGDVAGQIDKLDQSVKSNDDWTMRILALTPVLLLGYPVGKLVWMAGAAIKRRNGGARRVRS